MDVLSVAEMRGAEAEAVARGTSEAELQERAGAAVAAHGLRLGPPGPVGVLVGIGNNGRDGWVAAPALVQAQRPVRLYPSPRHALDDAELAVLQAAGGVVCAHGGDDSLATLRRWLLDTALVVDALLGIGARGAPRPPLDQFIGELNRARVARPELRVIAID